MEDWAQNRILLQAVVRWIRTGKPEHTNLSQRLKPAKESSSGGGENEVRAARFVLLRGDGKPSRGPAGFDDGEVKNQKWAAARRNWNDSPQIQIKPNSKEGTTLIGFSAEKQ
jgi:hypothetical protein